MTASLQGGYNTPMASIDSAGVPIHYEVIGEGPPIVLVHGVLSSLEALWDNTGWIDFLVALGRTVVGLDCRGHGLSGKPHNPDAYEGNQMADDVLAVMDAISIERGDLMGYSMGGKLAINLLTRFPNRFNSVIVGGAGLPLVSDAPMRPVVAAALSADDTSTIRDTTAMWMRNYAESRPHDPLSLAGLDNDLKALSACYGRYFRDLEKLDETALRTVSVPVLVVVGDQDDELPFAQQLAETVPGAQLLVLAGEDHPSAIRAQHFKDAVAAFLTTQHSVSLT
ncbi:MAG: alpha/beta hydrolase [Chloroflexi bacterium]|nr:alpha/beta hydrolase [Chloroflexota bacterium]